MIDDMDDSSSSSTMTTTPYISLDESVQQNNTGTGTGTNPQSRSSDHDSSSGTSHPSKSPPTRRRLAVCPEGELMDPPLLDHRIPERWTSRSQRGTAATRRHQHHHHHHHSRNQSVEGFLLFEERQDQSTQDRSPLLNSRLSPSSSSWTEDDYLRNAIPWESLEQRAYVDTLLERRAHYKSVRLLGGITLSLLLLVGCVGWILEHNSSYYLFLGDNTAATAATSATTTTTSDKEQREHPMLYIARWTLLGLICLAPLWVSCEGRTQEQLADQEIRHLTKKRMLLIPTPAAADGGFGSVCGSSGGSSGGSTNNGRQHKQGNENE